MSYYFFDKCPKQAVPQIERLAKELRLEEKTSKSIVPGYREWEGNPFKRRAKFDRTLQVNYCPGSKYPLTIQTSPRTNQEQPDVMVVIRKFIRICKPNQIYQEPCIPTPYPRETFD